MKDNTKISIYKRIYGELLEEIGNGTYSLEQKLPSEKELCSKYNVERNTVRKALKLLTDEGYIKRLPGVGTMLAQSSSDLDEADTNKGTVLMLIQRNERKNNISENFHMTLYNALEEKFSRAGYTFVIKIIGEADNFECTINAILPIAIIFDSYFSSHFYEKAVNSGLVCVSINNYTPYMTSITNNNADGAYRMIKLLSENGHKKIAVITGPINYQTTLSRLNGIKSYFLENNISDAMVKTYEGDWQYDSGYHITKELLESASKQDIPTAFFAFNDDMAYGCLAALTELKMEVPQDISLAGFDRSYKYGNILRQITTVDCNIDTISEYTLWYVRNSFESKANLLNASIEIKTEIVENGTIKNLTE